MNNGKNVYFIAGHHGIGKTYLLNKLSESFRLLHIDTGPLIRTIHQRETDNKINIGEWVNIGEEQYGLDFTNNVICKEIEDSIRSANDCPIFITGNRSLNGIKYIAKYFGLTDKMKIIYLDASFELLKNNYETREKNNLTNEEFQLLLDKEIKTGINDIRNYTIDNLDTCIYHYKEINDETVYYLLKSELSGVVYSLKKGRK